jgi:hypothetical protein
VRASLLNGLFPNPVKLWGAKSALDQVVTEGEDMAPQNRRFVDGSALAPKRM